MMDTPRSAPPSPIRGNDAKGIGTEPSGRSAAPRSDLKRERGDEAACVRPAAVDVNSGVEDADGRKDTEKMRAVVDSARAGLLGHRNAT